MTRMNSWRQHAAALSSCRNVSVTEAGHDSRVSCNSRKEGAMPKLRLVVGLVVGLAICAGVMSGTRAFQTAVGCYRD